MPMDLRRAGSTTTYDSPWMPMSGSIYSTTLQPSGDATGAADTVNIQNALTAAIPTAGTVVLQPGAYYLNNGLVVGPPAANAGHARPGPSLVAFNAAGHIGDNANFPQEFSPVEIIAAPSFPSGIFMLDYQENPTTGEQWTGAWIKGLTFSCNGRGAGVRFQGIRQFHIEDITIIQSQFVSNTYTDNSTGGFNVSSLGSFQTAGAWNYFNRITVTNPAQDAFFHNGPNQDVFFGCHALTFSRYGYNFNTASQCGVFYCDSTSVTAGNFAWYFLGAQVLLVGCSVEFGGNSANAILSDGQANDPTLHVKFVNCEFTNGPPVAPGEQAGSVVNLRFTSGRPQLMKFVGCQFKSSINGNTTDFVFVAASTTGTVTFDACDFTGPITGTKFNDQSGNNVLRFHNCPGINPVGVVSPAVPASGNATGAVAYDRTFYISTVAGTTTCSMAIQGGPTVPFVGATAQVVPVRVPAGQTVTPTYTGTAPTWVVEGE